MQLIRHRYFAQGAQLPIAALSLLMLVLSTGSALAEDHAHGSGYHPNYLAVFAGVTSESRRENAFTLGLEYERRLSERFGVGAIFEHAYGDLDFNIYAVQFAWHRGPWKLYVAPGIEDARHKSENEFLFRIGAEYGFEVGAYELAPQVDVDFVDGEEILVVGLTLGRGF